MSAKISPEARVAEYFRTAPFDKAEVMLEVVRQTMRQRKSEIPGGAPAKTTKAKKAVTRNVSAPAEEQTTIAGVANS